MLIIDEASMTPIHTLHAIDRLLQDITGVTVPFRGKIFLLGGDDTYVRSRDYNKTKQDGRVRKTKCVSSSDHTHASINYTVTFLTVAPRTFLFIYLYTAYLGECFHI